MVVVPISTDPFEIWTEHAGWQDSQYVNQSLSKTQLAIHRTPYLWHKQKIKRILTKSHVEIWWKVTYCRIGFLTVGSGLPYVAIHCVTVLVHSSKYERIAPLARVVGTYLDLVFPADHPNTKLHENRLFWVDASLRLPTVIASDTYSPSKGVH